VKLTSQRGGKKERRDGVEKKEKDKQCPINLYSILCSTFFHFFILHHSLKPLYSPCHRSHLSFHSCVQIQGPHPAQAASKALFNEAEKCVRLFLSNEGFNRWILSGPTNPKIRCMLLMKANNNNREPEDYAAQFDR